MNWLGVQQLPPTISLQTLTTPFQAMDSNIDPSIEAQAGIFTKFALDADDDLGTHHDNNTHDTEAQRAAHAALLAHEQASYTFADLNTRQDSATEHDAAAAANLSSILNFNEETTDTTSIEPQQHSNRPHDKHQTQLSFLQNALSLQRNPQASKFHQTTFVTDRTGQPKQVLVKDPSSVSIVFVNPAQKEGTGRLGRPRKNVEGGQTGSVLMENSSSNQEESLLSTFRVDSKPVQGPGSRGGKKVTPKKPKDKFVEYTFSNGSPSDTPQKPAEAKPEPSTGSQQTEEDVVIVSENTAAPPPTSQQSDAFILEDYESLKAKGRSVHKDKQDVFAKLGLVPLMPKKINAQHLNEASSDAADKKPPQPAAPRTRRPRAVIKEARKLKKKDIPGPITPALWDIYDPELLAKDKKAPPPDESWSKIALGYAVKPAPYAKDIMQILSFISKFKKFFKDVPSLGPQDLEEGLHLGSAEKYPLENVNQRDDETKESNASISETMDLLFRTLMMLLLNRKRMIPKSGLHTALLEFKTQVLSFGLPAEWRDDSGVFVAPIVDESLKSNEGDEPVDPNQPELFETVMYEYKTTKPLDHTPLDDEDFEDYGLQALQPKDRLILLRSMVLWCAAYSENIRAELNVQLNRQDASGEKDTYYVWRFVKSGEDGVNAANTSLKLHPRKKIKKAEYDEDSVTVDAYTDATVNPLDHHMSFRLLDFYAGDGGVNGRFFLCRTADQTTGGFGSMAALKQLMESDKPVHDMLGLVQPSRFKLYVEDVTTMLGAVLKQETVLGDETTETLDPWYEIAGSTAELNDFINFLEGKLQNVKSPKLSHLVEYLKKMVPLLTKFELIYRDYGGALSTTRESRKRAQVTDLSAQDRKLRKMIKESTGDEFLNHSEDEDEEEFDLEVGDDDDDDDYRE